MWSLQFNSFYFFPLHFHNLKKMNLAIFDPFKAIHSQILQAPTEVGAI